MQSRLHLYPDELKEFDESARTDRASEISAALSSTPDMDREGMAALAAKLNLAVVTGNLTINAQEMASLKNITSKFIPDAPKELNIKAEVKTQDVIVGWLENNAPSKGNVMDSAEAYAKVQTHKTASIEGFTSQFAIEEEAALEETLDTLDKIDEDFG